MTSVDKLTAALNNGVYETRDVLDYLKASLIAGSRPDAQILFKALVIALGRFQSRDFPLFCSMVPLQVHDSKDKEFEPFKALRDMENELERGSFEGFWALWAKRPESTPVPPNVEQNMRVSILQVIADSVIRIRQDRLTKAVNCDDIAKVAAAASVKLSVSNGEVTFEKNSFNFPQPAANSGEKLNLKRIAGLCVRTSGTN